MYVTVWHARTQMCVCVCECVCVYVCVPNLFLESERARDSQNEGEKTRAGDTEGE